MRALLMFLGGLALFFVGGSFAAMAVLDTSGEAWVAVLGVVGAVAAVVGIVLVARAFGFGWVGAP